ncbi:MAG: hypothetical protein AAGF99_02705 [Bacteroidota bacterium]
MPYTSARGPVSDEWVQENRTTTVRSGGQLRRVVLERRYRPRWRMRWEALTADQARTLREALAGGVIDFIPRTAVVGDLLPEVTYQVRLTSPVRTLEPLWRAAQGLWRAEVELVSVATYDRLPNVVSGGYYIVSEGADCVELGATGDATLTEETAELTFDGVTYTVPWEVVLGDELMAAVRTQPAPEPDALLIQTVPAPTS